MINNEHFEQLVDYIRYHLARGVPEAHLRQTLLQHGWSAELVDRAFMAIYVPLAPAAPHHAPAPNGQGEQPADPRQSSPAGSKHPRAKYGVFRALGDTLRAIRANAATFSLSVIASYAVALLSFVMLSFAADKAFTREINILLVSTSRLVFELFGYFFVYTTWFAFANALILCTLSLAIDDGRAGRRSSIGRTLSRGFAGVVRVAIADFLFSVILYWPLLVILMLPIILVSSSAGVGGGPAVLYPLLVLMAIVWIIIALLRFTLAPYVALFEPDVPVLKTLGRSKHLLAKGGQWFLVKGFFMLLPLLLVLSAIAGIDHAQDLLRSSNVIVNMALLVLSIFINGCLVMLYRHCKSVRG